MVVYFSTATKRRSRGASWSIIAPPFINGISGRQRRNLVDVCVTRAVGLARALTNSGRRNQRRRDGARRGSGTEAGELAGQAWRDRTERRTETGSASTKDYAGVEDDEVNQRARKSVEGNNLAPQDVHRSEHAIGEFRRRTFSKLLTRGKS